MLRTSLFLSEGYWRCRCHERLVIFKNTGGGFYMYIRRHERGASSTNMGRSPIHIKDRGAARVRSPFPLSPRTTASLGRLALALALILMAVGCDPAPTDAPQAHTCEHLARAVTLLAAPGCLTEAEAETFSASLLADCPQTAAGRLERLADLPL
ncbi:MAG: hypothetical protein CMH54_01880, partial [Myxococcales bacterium]|nr:hypothetical protein [Myxococcales bacterium]